jgi:hypothetical protein
MVEFCYGLKQLLTWMFISFKQLYAALAWNLRSSTALKRATSSLVRLEMAVNLFTANQNCRLVTYHAPCLVEHVLAAPLCLLTYIGISIWLI